MKTFNELIDSAAQRAILNDERVRLIISRIVPPDMLAHVQFFRIEQRVIKITVDNASWLARLRFIARQIIDELNKDGLLIEHVTWHVTPASANVAPRERLPQPRVGSSKAAAVLSATANSMEDDELKAALTKMAAQLAKRQPV